MDCPCKRIKCERHGNCDACRKHHADSTTACERIAKRKNRKMDKKCENIQLNE